MKNGFTLVEGLIVLTILAIVGMSANLLINGDKSFVTNKQSCMDAGGKWSEGIQYGRMTQLCTYN